eukprot:gnl/TRDRNA2_/TRDRNA2_179235_c0_seq1.p1 gnl/TRDRNA2_/TRDRNA2_179235_c0~~gnl/TRDRNA2_/TRDRNA2_179235_c0_seq1.p1  ORF type:complete len:356 (-),score=125.79 gnl/TRDRNA2_/TRDRNA2_179235_c0_seq1:62-1129(-)
MAPPSDEEKAKLWENARKQVQGEEDPPIVASLKKVDDQYLELQKQFERERKQLCREYTEKQRPLLEERAKKLEGDGSAEDSKTGTPAIKGFWCQALKNHPAFEDIVETWDEPVLEYLTDIVKVDLDPENYDAGFRIRFMFAENPFFTNSVLSKEYVTGPPNAYNGEQAVEEIRGCEIDWKPGKDVTFEVVKKKVKGGGAKKAKQAGKESKEMRPSFFRVFFMSIKQDGRLPESVDAEALAMQAGMMGDDDLDEEDLVDVLMEGDHERGMALRDNVIPYAVRWYTGEAAPDQDDEDDDDFDEDDEEDDEDDDDEDDDEDEDDEPPVKGKKGKGEARSKKEPAAGGDGKKEEDCKQQ